MTESYTLYDELGRVKEAGQKNENDENAPKMKSIFGTFINGYYNVKSIDDDKLALWLNDVSGTRKQVTRTIYDTPFDQNHPICNFVMPVPITQTHLRKRVSAVFYQEEYEEVLRDYNSGSSGFEQDFNFSHATYYSYDIHGNVKTLVQDQPSMTIGENELAEMRYKRMDYTYDLISGNVHEVNYQGGKLDAMHHHYLYDGDNRITDVFTSTEAYPLDDFYSEGVGWSQDAAYRYYQHGPLARVELGEHLVQGIDYAYTLQGWLKGVNGEDLNPNMDMGGDARTGHLHANVAKDAFSFSLGYYQGDYEQINSTAPQWLSPTGGDLIANREDLWNGNIGHMLSNMQTATGVAADPDDVTGKLGMSYRYDQLNRIVQAKSSTETAGVWNAMANDAYFNHFTYDGNGNILTQKRKDQHGDLIDDLTYHYHKVQGMLLSNRLYHVEDASGALGEGGIGNTSAVTLLNGNVDTENNNYLYTEIGELKSDALEGIEEIIWRVDSKISRIKFLSSSGKDNLKFEYDAMGNRVAKYVMQGQTEFPKHVTFYVRDASGNVMAVYEHDLEIPESYHLSERHIYGSSRIGMVTKKVELNYTYSNNASVAIDQEPLAVLDRVDVVFTTSLGYKQYELSNHLGNVLAVIGDQKLPVLQGGVVVSFEAHVISSQDYSPFGVTLSGRSRSAGYRWGFTGLERDDEVNGSGNHYSFGDYGYDPRTIRRWNVDPRFNEIAGLSSYAYALNNPIVYKDPDGELPILPLLLKAGAAGAADMLAQAAMAYYFDPKVESVGQAFETVNWWQVARSTAEGLIPWNTPGGRIGRAAATATGDVLVNAIDAGSDYTQEQALKDFATGFIGDLAGGGLGELVAKYGTKGVANGLLKMGFDAKYIRQATGGLSNKEVRSWYSDQVKKIDINIAPTEANARMIVNQRNSLKQQARDLMSDRKAAAELDKTDPIRGFDYYNEKYGGDYSKIMKGGTTPNADVNKKFDVK